MNSNRTTGNCSCHGFTLAEMMIVIAVIGIITGFALPNISNFQDSGSDARNRRNAQSIAGVFAAAQAAGLDFSTGLTTKTEIIDAVLKGGTVATGPLSGTTFQLPSSVSRETDEVAGAAKYLEWNLGNGMLIYHNSDPSDGREAE